MTTFSITYLFDAPRSDLAERDPVIPLLGCEQEKPVWIALFPFKPGHGIKNPPQISSGDRFSVQYRDTALRWIEMGK